MKKLWCVFFLMMWGFVTNAQTKVHVVKSGETLYALCKKYNVSIAQLKSWNKQLAVNTNIQVGQKIIVAPTAAHTSSGTSTTQSRGTAAKVHIVTRGESLTSISKKYGVSITTLKQWNSLHDSNVKIGQKLIVNKANPVAIYKPNAVPSTPDTEYSEEDTRRQRTMIAPEKINITASERAVTETGFSSTTTSGLTTDALRTTATNPAEYPAVFNQYAVVGFQIRKNRGTASYLNEVTSGNQHLAFFSGAETGSIIRVTNMVNQQTIYVKVVGKLPPSDVSKGFLIKLTNKAALDLGAADDKLLVEVASYFKE